MKNLQPLGPVERGGSEWSPCPVCLMPRTRPKDVGSSMALPSLTLLQFGDSSLPTVHLGESPLLKTVHYIFSLRDRSGQKGKQVARDWSWKLRAQPPTG